MRRIDLINAVVNIQKAFAESKIQNFLFSSSRTEQLPESVIAAFQIYSRAYDTFGPNEKRIVEVFGLKNLGVPKTLAIILASDKTNDREILRLIV